MSSPYTFKELLHNFLSKKSHVVAQVCHRADVITRCSRLLSSKGPIYADKSIQFVEEEKDMSEQWVIGLMSSPDFQGGQGN